MNNIFIDKSSMENITWPVMGKQTSPAEKVYSIQCMRSLSVESVTVQSLSPPSPSKSCTLQMPDEFAKV